MLVNTLMTPTYSKTSKFYKNINWEGICQSLEGFRIGMKAIARVKLPFQDPQIAIVPYHLIKVNDSVEQAARSNPVVNPPSCPVADRM